MTAITSTHSFATQALQAPVDQPATKAGIIDCLPGDDIWVPPAGINDTKEGWRISPDGNGGITIQPKLDTGRFGPDMVNVEIHEDGGATVTVNGKEYHYTREQMENGMSVVVDNNDNVQIQDRRSYADRRENPQPVELERRGSGEQKPGFDWPPMRLLPMPIPRPIPMPKPVPMPMPEAIPMPKPVPTYVSEATLKPVPMPQVGASLPPGVAAVPLPNQTTW